MINTVSSNDVQQVQLAMRCSNIALLFCTKFCKVIFFRCHKISKLRVANRAKLDGLNLFSRLSGIVEQDMGYLFVTLSISHFFNKTDL